MHVSFRKKACVWEGLLKVFLNSYLLQIGWLDEALGPTSSRTTASGMSRCIESPDTTLFSSELSRFSHSSPTAFVRSHHCFAANVSQICFRNTVSPTEWVLFNFIAHNVELIDIDRYQEIRAHPILMAKQRV